mmetsp:Transcript_3388/g.9896  ORF Transcript_3388/g.9896 Transcript_3388/m.9896 type:complete len:242 (+) Transcript_3388:56-781(+)
MAKARPEPEPRPEPRRRPQPQPQTNPNHSPNPNPKTLPHTPINLNPMASEGGSSSPWLGLIAGAAMGAYGAYTIAKSAGALHKVDTSQRGYTVVITGSTRGLGRAMAQEFLTYGDKVVVNGRSLESVARTVEELKRAAPDGAEVLGFAADVADAAAVQKMADAAKREFGSIDFWINNAGMSQASCTRTLTLALTPNPNPSPDPNANRRRGRRCTRRRPRRWRRFCAPTSWAPSTAPALRRA